MIVVETKKNIIYEVLRDEIVEGNLRPGERIVISNLASKYEVSQMPVREAIDRLQLEGFIESTPHIGARVMEMSLDDLREILMIRMELEPLACKLSAPFITEETFTQLDEILDKMAQCLSDNNHYQFGKLNKQLHITVYCAGPHKIVQNLIKSLWDRSEYTRNIFRVNVNRNKESHEEHLAWIQALRNGDAEQAVEVLKKQKRTQFDKYLEFLEQREMFKGAPS